MAEFDVRTVLTILCAVSVLQVLVLVFYYLVAPRYAGVALWVWGAVAAAVGFLLLVLRGQIPDLLSVVVANAALLGSSILLHRGIIRFVGQPRPGQDALVLGVLAVTVALYLPLTYTVPSVSARTVVISIAVGSVHLLNCLNLVRAAAPGLRFSFVYTAVVVGLYGAWLFTRALLTALADPLASVFDQNTLQGFSYLVILVAMIFWTAGLAAMCTQRLLRDLRQAQESERVLLERSAEQAHEREQLFRLTFDQSPLGAALLGLDARFQRVNPALCAITGYSEAELLGIDFRNLLHSDDLAAGVEQTTALAQGERDGFSLDQRIVHKSGASIWAQLTGRLMRGATGRPLHMLALLEDISARKSAERALRNSQLQLEQALSAAELGFWDWHIPSGTFAANEQLAQLIGYRLAEITPVVEIWRREMHDDDRPRADAAFQDAIDGKAASINVEFRMRHRDGTWRWQQCCGRAIEHDAGGSAVRLLGVTQDINERKRAELALAEREALLRAVGANMPNSVAYQVLEGPSGVPQLSYVSASVERLTGLSAQEIGADFRRFWELVDKEDRARLLSTASSSFDIVASFDGEFRLRTPAGETKWLHAMSTARVLEDGRRESTGMAVDITQRKQSELALRHTNEELRWRLSELSALHRIAQALTQWVELPSALHAVAATVRDMFAGAGVGVWASDQAGAIRHLAACGGEMASEPVAIAGDALLTELLEHPRSRVLAASAQLPSIAGPPYVAADAVGDVMVLPMQTRGHVIGVLLIRAADGRSWVPSDLALGQTVAGTLANAIENARLAEQAQAAAAEDERKRLARDLHDSVSQALFQINLTAGVLPQLWEQDAERGRKALGHLLQISHSAVAEMRSLLVELRPATLERATLHELLPYLVNASAAKAELHSDSDLAPLPLLPSDVQIAFYRVAQEALNNVVKHAGASNVRISLQATPPLDPSAQSWCGEVRLVVADDGRGFDAAKLSGSCLGLDGMRERAAAIGATLEISSAHEAGTRVELRWQGTAKGSEGKQGST